ncbi:MAG: peptide chain release factor-like protein [Candidatus Omnitrophica bacterium]|nr:peptide chain release factor-like protein [Candidatus Omnitrophota bacterium]
MYKLSLHLSDLKKQTTVTFYRSSGPGGQRKNKRETAVRLHHRPTGVTSVATEHRYQSANLELAFHRLKDKLKQLSKKPKPRIPTNVSRAKHEKRLEKKKIHSQKKVLRRKVGISEDLF